MTTTKKGPTPRPEPAAVKVPDGVTKLTFLAQDDTRDSTIDVEYTITSPENVEFSSGGRTTNLDDEPVRVLNATPISKNVGFHAYGGIPDAIEIDGIASPASGDSFPVSWTIGLAKGSKSSPKPVKSKAKSIVKPDKVTTEVLELLARLMQLLPEFAAEIKRLSDADAARRRSDGDDPS